MTYTHLLFDLPSVHEVDDRLVTECDVISSIISNKGKGRVKHIRATHLKTLRKKRPAKRKRYRGIRYVHVAGHATRNGPAFIGKTVSWETFAKELCYYFKPLDKGEKRALCLSCCYSERAAYVLGNELKSRFSAFYYFSKETVYFDDTMVAWSLFYLLKPMNKPTIQLKMKNEQGKRITVKTPQLINSVIRGVGFSGPKRPRGPK